MIRLINRAEPLRSRQFVKLFFFSVKGLIRLLQKISRLPSSSIIPPP